LRRRRGWRGATLTGTSVDFSAGTIMLETLLVGVVSVLVVGILGSMLYASYALASICEWNERRPNGAFRGGGEELMSRVEAHSAAAAEMPRIRVDTLIVMVLFALSLLLPI
jgi:hypothetical protein